MSTPNFNEVDKVMALRRIAVALERIADAIEPNDWTSVAPTAGHLHPDDGHLLTCTINFDGTWSCDPTCPNASDRPSAKEQP